MKQIMHNLSFEVVAVPQTNVGLPTNTTEVTPVNFKVRVKKRDATCVSEKGVISVANLSNIKGYPEKIRLVSSNQTIMSFNVESEFDKKSQRKPQKKIFHLFKTGKCLGAQSDDDDLPYMVTSENKANIIKSRLLELDNKQKLDLSRNSSNHERSKEFKKMPKTFLGKCKPGGCLDPPFNEEKYKYQPALRNTLSVSNVKQKYEIQKTSFSKCDEVEESKNSTPIVKPTHNNEQDMGSTQMLYQAKSIKESLDVISSNLIITYPLKTPSGEIRAEKNNFSRNISIDTSKQVNYNANNADVFFMPPKTCKSPDRRKLSLNTEKNNKIMYDKTEHKEDIRDSDNFKGTPISLFKEFKTNDKCYTTETIAQRDHKILYSSALIDTSISQDGISSQTFNKEDPNYLNTKNEKVLQANSEHVKLASKTLSCSEERTTAEAINSDNTDSNVLYQNYIERLPCLNKKSINGDNTISEIDNIPLRAKEHSSIDLKNVGIEKKHRSIIKDPSFIIEQNGYVNRDSKQSHIEKFKIPIQENHSQNNKSAELNKNDYFLMDVEQVLPADEAILYSKEKIKHEMVDPKVSATGNIRDKEDNFLLLSSHSQNSLIFNMVTSNNESIKIEYPDENLQLNNFKEPYNDLQSTDTEIQALKRRLADLEQTSNNILNAQVLSDLTKVLPNYDLNKDAITLSDSENSKTRSLKSHTDILETWSVKDKQEILKQYLNKSKSQDLPNGDEENIKEEKKSQVASDFLKPYNNNFDIDQVINDKIAKSVEKDIMDIKTIDYKDAVTKIGSSENYVKGSNKNLIGNDSVFEDIFQAETRTNQLDLNINIKHDSNDILGIENGKQSSINSLKMRAENNFINLNNVTPNSHDQSYAETFTNSNEKSSIISSNLYSSPENIILASEKSIFTDNVNNDVTTSSSAVIRNTGNDNFLNKRKVMSEDSININPVLTPIVFGDEGVNGAVLVTDKIMSHIKSKYINESYGHSLTSGDLLKRDNILEIIETSTSSKINLNTYKNHIPVDKRYNNNSKESFGDIKTETVKSHESDLDTTSPQSLSISPNKELSSEYGMNCRIEGKKYPTTIGIVHESDNAIQEEINNESISHVTNQRDKIHSINTSPKNGNKDLTKKDQSLINNRLLGKERFDINNTYHIMERDTRAKLSENHEKLATAVIPESLSINFSKPTHTSSNGKSKLALISDILNNEKEVTVNTQDSDCKKDQIVNLNKDNNVLNNYLNVKSMIEKEESLNVDQKPVSTKFTEYDAEKEVIIDLGFQTYVNKDKQKILKTVDIFTDPQRFPNDNISIIKTVVKQTSGEISFAINSETKLSLQINKPSPVTKVRNGPIPADIGNVFADEIKGVSRRNNVSDIKFTDIEELQNTLSAVYENNLVPVEKLMKSLISDIDKMTVHRHLSKKKSISNRKLKSTYSRCGCLRN